MTVKEVRELEIDSRDLHVDGQYDRFKYLALKINSTVTKLRLSLSSDTNPYCSKLLKELFQSNSNISSLRLIPYYRINDEKFKNLCELIKIESNIRELDLGCIYSHFLENPDKFRLMLDSLKENKNIKEIVLAKCKILEYPENIIVLSDFLKTAKHIQKLDLNSSSYHYDVLPDKQELPKNNVQLLFEALVQNNSLMELDLSGNCLRSAIVYLSTYLKGNQTLTKLNLGDTHFANSIEDMVAFSEALTINKSLQELNLERNHLVPVLEVLTQAIKINKSLKILNLNWTSIGGDSSSMNIFSDVLICNKTIHTLYLHHNQIGRHCDSFEPLCEAIKKNKTIKELYLDYNFVGSNPYNFNNLTLALRKNKTICKLGLRDNILLFSDNIIFKKFCELIKTSTSLKELDLSRNVIGEYFGNIKIFLGNL